MTVALSIVTPIITSGLGPDAQVRSECLALTGAIAVVYGMGKITHHTFAPKFIFCRKKYCINKHFKI